MTRSLLVLLAVMGLSSPVLAGGDVYSDRYDRAYDTYDEYERYDETVTYRDVADAPPPPDRGPPLGIYDRIEAHYGPMGREVREDYRDGPCRVERRWERDGDFEEHIKCRGPRR